MGPEFRVNTYTTGDQDIPVVARTSNGFVVVWASTGQDGSYEGVFGQRYDPAGTPLGPEFRVNTGTTSIQSWPAVAADSAGNFVVVWQSYQTGSHFDIEGQRFSVAGAPLGSEFRVNTFTAFEQSYPKVAVDPAGDFVVVWSSHQQPSGTDWDVAGQRYSSSGVPLGTEFRVNSYTPEIQLAMGVAMAPSGDFVVTWDGQSPVDDFGDVSGQRFSSSGAPLGPEFAVNSYTTGRQFLGSVTTDSVGNFVVAWESYSQDGAGYEIFGQRFAGSGAPLGPEFHVNTVTASHQVRPSISSDSVGNFMVVWQSYEGEGSEVEGQRFKASGEPAGTEFRVNTYTPGLQGFFPSVSADSSGVVVAWPSEGQDGSSYGVYAQRFATIFASTISFVQASSHVAEGGGSASADVRLTTADGQPSTDPVTVDFGTADGTATAGADYTPASGTLSFPAGTPDGTIQSILVPILQDALPEPSETFSLGLSNPAGVVLGRFPTHTVSIDDDDTPVVSVGDASTLEGPSGLVTPLSVPVTLSFPCSATVSVGFETNDGTATAGSDYAPLSGTLVFAPGETSAVVTIAVYGDDVGEADETLTVDLANPTNATLGDAQGLETIVNDDVLAKLSRTELTHGQSIQADLRAQPGPAADTDSYSLLQQPFSSYEVVVDGTSGELGPSGPTLERVAPDGVTVLQSSVPAGAGPSRSLRFENATNAAIADELILVRGPACGASCDANAVYRIRLFETTERSARFNNAATQLTVLLVQNQSDAAVAGHLQFWDAAGTLLASPPFALPPHGTLSFDTVTIPELLGQSGSISICHDGRWGALEGKAVAIEPATGFTFDTPLVSRPR